MPIKPTKRVLWSWFLVVMAAAIPLSLGLYWVGHWFFPQIRSPLLFLWGCFLLFLVGIYLPLRQKSISFALDESQITVTGGVWFRVTRRMQVEAVRQVTLIQGPLERRLGTAFLLVSATGGHLWIEGIDQDRGEAWCRHLTCR